MMQLFSSKELGTMVGAPKQVLSLLATQSEADSDMISGSLIGTTGAGRLENPTIYKDLIN